jgi:N-acetylmuramoyl-L-alanine amidase
MTATTSHGLMHRLVGTTTLLFIVSAVALSPSPAFADDDPSVASFVAIKKDVENLRTDAERKKYRHHYEKLIVRLQAVANTYPRGQRADDCAFVAAQLLEELAQVSFTSADRAAAVDAFASMAERFPKSNLADDALVAGARLTDDIGRGRGMVDKVIAMKGADVKKEAQLLRTQRFSDAAVKAAKTAKAAKKATPQPSPAAKTATEVASAPATSTGKPASLTIDRALARVGAVPSTPSTTTESTTTVAETNHEGHGHDEEGETTAASTSSAPLPSSLVTTVTTTGSSKQYSLVLPERPPLGTPARKVMVIRHEKTDTDSVVRLRISGEVGVLKGDVPPGERSAGRRIFYDVSPARLGQRNIQPIEVHDGVIARVRAGQYDTDIVRLVIELEGEREPALFITKKPFELVLSTPLSLPQPDIIAGRVSPAPPTAAPPPDAEEVRARLSQSQGTIGAPGGISISQQLGLRVHRVVIDAGHGGHDTGAIGPSGVKEKDITLALAKQVKELLNAELPDIEVIMTREDDRTLALQDRTNTANAAAADLFISIHCNASPLKRVRGVETYYLNITHDRYAMRLAARENAQLDDGSISDLDFILADLAMKSNVDDSVRLGRSVQGALVKKLHQNWPDVPDLGLKHALFYVLMGNRMPSILVETSFLSHKTEERRLASSEYQASIVKGIVAGVRAFVADRQAFYDTTP